MTVDVHHLTQNPTAAWKELSKTQKVIKINVSNAKNDVLENMVRFVCMSDTHSLTSHLKFDIPNGDVFIHAGDFTRCGGEDEVVNFSNWIEKLPHKYKIVIAGNHELSFDPTFTHPLTKKLPFQKGYEVDEIPTLGLAREDLKEAVENVDIRNKLTNCIYLEDTFVKIYGIKIYGTPWQPEFCKWAFNLPRGQECLEKWNLIPDDIDILVTHTPPLGFGDLCCTGVRAGCTELLTTVQKRVMPKYHIFGHVHEGYGVFSDGKIIFINASTCNINYLPVNPPIVFDIPLRPGKIKTDG
ncbi:hypothetical protein PGB90_006997 [Kerria lacca]